jgi:hypothetical protein
MRTATILVFTLTCFCIIVTDAFSQIKPDIRYPFQIYFEDSVHVFWTQYPNPFSPTTMVPGRTENRKGSYCGDLSFYCDLSDSVTVVALDQADSAVYSTQLKSKYSPNFSVCYWLAGSQISLTQLPHSYIRSNSLSIQKLMLVVSGRNKALRSYGINIPKGWYFWLQSQN